MRAFSRKRKKLRSVVFACATLIGSLQAGAALAQTIAITGGRILGAENGGVIELGTVLIDNGRIVAVGADVRVPVGARVIEANGKVVTAGLIAPNTALGLTEISSISPADDTRSSSPILSAAFDVSGGFNPLSANIPAARQGGVTRAVTLPQYDLGNPGRYKLFAGQGAFIALDSAAPDLKPRSVMVLDAGEDGASRAGGSRGVELGLLTRNIADARLYARKRADYERGSLRELSLSQDDLEALQPVLAGHQPLLVGVSRASDILQILELAKAENLKIILSGAEEAWLVADQIAAANVPVILNPISNLPLSYEVLAATLENAARLHAAGVKIAFIGNDVAHRVRELRYNAGIAVAHGLPYAAAIDSITRNPAEIFGVSDRLGTLEAGKLADVVVWSGDPLEPSSYAQHVFIAGREQDLDRSRPAQLRDKYAR